MRDAIETYLRSHDDFLQSAKDSIRVHVASLGESSIDLSVYCFTVTTDLQSFLTIKEALIFHILETVEAAGTSLALPVEAVVMERTGSKGR